MDPIITYIEKEIAENNVILFMKGNVQAPVCGFSAVVVQILKKFNVSFQDINVLADPELREGIKVYSNWPTIPQLYIKGEFIGGADIVKEMYQNGEFEALLIEKGLYSKEVEL